MAEIKFMVFLLVSFVLTFVNAQQKDTYTYQGAEVRRWQDFKPYFGVNRHPVASGPTTFQPYPYVPLIPEEPVFYNYPPYNAEDFDYEYNNFQKIPTVPKQPMKVVNVTAERMGGFGGTGDMRGYGAYDYKTEEEPYDQQKLDNKPYKTKTKKGKKNKEAYKYLDDNNKYYDNNDRGKSGNFNFDELGSFSYSNVDDVSNQFKFHENKPQKQKNKETYKYIDEDSYPTQQNEPYKQKNSQQYQYRNKDYEYQKEEPYRSKQSKEYDYQKEEPYRSKQSKKYGYQKEEPYRNKQSKEYDYQKEEPYRNKQSKEYDYQKEEPYRNKQSNDYQKEEPYRYNSNEQYKYDDGAIDPFRYMDDDEMFAGMNFEDFFRLPKERKDDRAQRV